MKLLLALFLAFCVTGFVTGCGPKRSEELNKVKKVASGFRYNRLYSTKVNKGTLYFMREGGMVFVPD